jgi:hypothetical protein
MVNQILIFVIFQISLFPVYLASLILTSFNFPSFGSSMLQESFDSTEVMQ